MCEKTPSGLQLHYYSKRKGLHHIVVGIVKAAAKEFYSLDVELDMIREEVLNSDYRPHHYVFEITTKEPSQCALKSKWESYGMACRDVVGCRTLLVVKSQKLCSIR